jgi:signal transduction histidine kinase
MKASISSSAAGAAGVENRPGWLRGLWQRLRERRLGTLRQLLRRLGLAMQIPPAEPMEWIRRVALMERDVILPIKAVGIPLMLYFFYSSKWIDNVSKALDIEFDFADFSHYFLWFYAGFLWFYVMVNGVVAVFLVRVHRRSLVSVQRVVFAIGLMDGILFSFLALVTGGYNSILYWLFPVLIVRSAVSVPRASSQFLLSLTLSGCFMFAGFVDTFVADNLDPESRNNLRLSAEYPAEPVVLRMSLLLMLTVCCYGVQVLLERQRRVEAEAREFAVREAQLRSAGRVAAEFVHQIKNPLAIINTAAFSLQRALKDRPNPDVTDQIRMIQEEVERSDRIITQLMGYAQLSEGRVERLNVIEELDGAVERVFPAAAHYPVLVHRDYGMEFPSLLMQRRHLSETLINILQNAREALGAKGGNVWIRARCREDFTTEISIRDDGPGVPPDKQGRVFEAYYTTKEKGTGLGLASAKHNVELYGGSVRVESGLGKGARFVLLFPARTLMKPTQST